MMPLWCYICYNYFPSRFAGVRFSLNKRCARSPFQSTPLATRGLYLKTTRVGIYTGLDYSSSRTATHEPLTCPM